MNKFVVSVLAIVVWGPAAFGMSKYSFVPDAGKIEFKTKGWPSLITIKGEGKGVQGELVDSDGKISGDLVFKLGSLKTGIDLRDRHMKEKYLEVEKFPTAKLTLKGVEAPAELNGQIKFKGLLELHGQTKEVTVIGELKDKGTNLMLSGEIPIQLTDFKVPIPSYKGITVAEKVTVLFESTVQKVL